MNPLRCLPLAMLVAFLTVPARSADSERPAKADQPFEVEVVKDVPYNGVKDADPDKHKLDLYLPKGKKDFPVLFFVHGGTWKSGDRKTYVKLGEAFAEHG